MDSKDKMNDAAMKPCTGRNRIWMNRCRGWFLTGVLLLTPAICMGLSTDQDKPIYIEANYAELDDEEGVSVYRGDVKLTQGTLHLTGQEMTVYTTGDYLRKAILIGSPATYRQRPDGKDEDMHAESRRMEYYAEQDRIILLDKARVWQGEINTFSSDRIEYDMKNNIVNAGESGGSQRVHITLQPKPQQESDNGEPESQ